MSGPVRIAVVAAGVVVAGWLAWAPARNMYLGPRAELGEEIESLTGQVAGYRADIARMADVKLALRDYADRTFGGDLETVDHRLRSRLNEIGAEIGLGELSVGTGRSRRLESPGRRKFSGALRDEIDAIELEGWINGVGSLEQVLRLVHRIQSERWLKRVNVVKVDPKGDGKRFGVNVRLVTLFLPGREPDGEPEWTYDASSFAPYETLLASTPFTVPPKEAPKPAPQARPEPRPAGFPYGQWVVTGVARGPGGTEVWLVNTASSESRAIPVGERFHDLALVAAEGDTATFEKGGQPVRVRVGQTLAAAAR